MLNTLGVISNAYGVCQGQVKLQGEEAYAFFSTQRNNLEEAAFLIRQ